MPDVPPVPPTPAQARTAAARAAYAARLEAEAAAVGMSLADYRSALMTVRAKQSALTRRRRRRILRLHAAGYVEQDCS